MHSREFFQEIVRYAPARLHTGKYWYISYYAFNPESGKLDIKRIKLNYIKNATERRRFAWDMIKRINVKLESGWNPFTEKEGKRSYLFLSEAFTHYRKVIEKQYKSGDIRNETYFGFTSYLQNFEDWLKEKNLSNIFVYQFDKGLLNRFLEYIYVERNRASKTRDNYLAFLRVLSKFLVQNEYLKVKPTDEISCLGKRSREQKNRSVISKEDLEKLFNYLDSENKSFLLASKILYYCFIRPKEMSYIKIKHIDLEKQTIFIPGETAKNYKNAVVTIPLTLKNLMETLEVKNFPGEYYLFSNNIKPGTIRRDEKQFRDYWAKVKKELNFPGNYKFYSLKDTGITDMIKKTNDTIIVRDQARHHSIVITDMYTPHEIKTANPIIKELT